MDRITEALLAGFSKEHSLEHLPEDKRFEHLTAFAMIRRHYNRSFSTADVVLGGGGDTGVDSIAIIVNNRLVTDADTVHELAEQNDYIEPTFIFVQAERSSSFDGQKIGNISFGIVDFFSKSPKIPRSVEVSNLSAITDVIIGEYAAILKPPRCHVYYVTTGQWVNDPHLVARRDAAIQDIKNLSIFENPDIFCMGATELHGAYRRTKSPISRTFLFDRRVEIPATAGVTQAAIGFLPFAEFEKLLLDESGTEMLTSIFEDNIRDWQGYKTVNSGIRETLLSEAKSNFVLMNNGITIITRNLNRVGDIFTISDYQIVNGCQTSNVLFEQRKNIDNSVTIPVRLIHTSEENIKELITTATNSQTEIKPEQFASSKNFARGLEQFFLTFPDDRKLYYERRDGQYDRGSEPKIRIIDIATVLRSFAAIWMEIPHTATKNYKSIREEIGEKVFADGHKYVAYYYAAYAYFLLEGHFRAKTIDPKYKSARFHILMTVNLMLDSTYPQRPNSKDLETRSNKALEALWDTEKADALFAGAVAIIDEVTEGNLDRDHVRTEAITHAIITRFRAQVSRAPADAAAKAAPS
ncbi:AIPR family protein [Sphingobium sp. TKS]|uniref:AIPR family protein n=1 Tax=Sphingobium sp. TKS TaxID=1315974 RepID=UPI00131412B0|nr:AIPR family protein [Sphingobium sp. TKS]